MKRAVNDTTVSSPRHRTRIFVFALLLTPVLSCGGVFGFQYYLFARLRNRARELAVGEGAQIVAAIERYQRNEGRYPGDLARDLAPRYLASVSDYWMYWPDQTPPFFGFHFSLAEWVLEFDFSKRQWRLNGEALNVPPPPLQATTASIRDRCIRAVTWNIQKCEGGIDKVAKELSFLDADVLFLQEVIEPRGSAKIENQTEKIAASLGMHRFSDCGVLDELRSQCIAILSRSPLQSAVALSINDARSYAVAATAEFAGEPVGLICVHLAGTWKFDMTHINRTTADREQEAEHLAAWIDRQTIPLIVGGDFNPVSPERIELLSRRLPEVAGFGATFPSSSPALQLDRMFCSPKFVIERSETVESTISDHLPAFAIFQMKERE